MPNVFLSRQINSSWRPSAPERNADLVFLLVFFSCLLFSLGLKHKAGCPWQPWESSHRACISIREVEGAFCVSLCSFSSTAHLVGYYAKEMESIAERWVTLFTGKSDDQRQGITPARSDVSWKIPLFHREEGKYTKLERVGRSSRALRWKRRRDDQTSELIPLSPIRRAAGSISHTRHSISAHSHLLRQTRHYPRMQGPALDLQ